MSSEQNYFDPAMHAIDGITCSPDPEFFEEYLRGCEKYPAVWAGLGGVLGNRLHVWYTYPCSQLHTVKIPSGVVQTAWDLANDTQSCRVISSTQIDIQRNWFYPEHCSCRCSCRCECAAQYKDWKSCSCECLYGGDPCIHPNTPQIFDIHIDSDGIVRGTGAMGIQLVIGLPTRYDPTDNAYRHAMTTITRRRAAKRTIANELVLPWLYRPGGIRMRSAETHYRSACA